MFEVHVQDRGEASRSGSNKNEGQLPIIRHPSSVDVVQKKKFPGVPNLDEDIFSRRIHLHVTRRL
jgi:hypothetical protein